MTQYDVLTFGETMLRFSPPAGQRLGQASAFDVYTAGSESNVAAALCALGCSATWIGRLPDNPLGRRIDADLRARGVDTSWVVRTSPDDRVGVLYVEPAGPPRPATVLYDRAWSAAASLCSDDIPASLLDNHRHLHVTGITPALSESCAQTVTDAVRRSKELGLTVSIDVNYRAKLWSPDQAAAALSPLLAAADVAFCSKADAQLLFGLAGDDPSISSGLRARFGLPVAVLTVGAAGAAACDDDGVCAEAAVPGVVTVERLGSGDAFAAGFLAEYLSGAPLSRCLRLGVAAAAVKRTILGDMLIATRAEVDAVLAKADQGNWR